MTKSTIKNVLVTGGAGFIGSHILDLLVTAGYKVSILERQGGSLDRIKPHLKKITVCYSDQAGIEQAFKKNQIDCVIHLATCYIKNHQGESDVAAILDTNVKLPSILLEYCRQYGVKYFINTGTFFEYEQKDRPLTEEDKKIAYNLYAASKLAFEEVLKYYAESFKIKVIDFKLFAPFGDRDNEKLMAYLVKLLGAKEPTDFSGGEQKWNFTYVKDIAEAYLKALEHFDYIKGYELINVGYDQVVSIKEVALRLEKISGKKLNIRFGAKPYIDDEIFYANCDNTKLKKLLNWEPKYSFEEGLKQTYLYFSQLYDNRGNKE
jgi:nucleoside-diphosphate-sugar epimerase